MLTVLDNTWATPLFLKPIPLGINISIQSVTKYIGGHSDLLLGAVTVDQHCAETFSRFYDLMETFAPPADCGLALRGLRTLAVRLRQHERSALEVAQWLRTRPEVDRILHPALAEHPPSSEFRYNNSHSNWASDNSPGSRVTAKSPSLHCALLVFIHPPHVLTMMACSHTGKQR